LVKCFGLAKLLMRLCGISRRGFMSLCFSKIRLNFEFFSQRVQIL
jgi:hypothetical protein